jgi:hypothetical protein
VSALGGTIEVADPGQLQLELLVLVVIVGDVDDACGLLDTVQQRQLAVGEVELLEFGLGNLSSLAGSSAVVSLCMVLDKCNDLERKYNAPSTGHSARSCTEKDRRV